MAATDATAHRGHDTAGICAEEASIRRLYPESFLGLVTGRAGGGQEDVVIQAGVGPCRLPSQVPASTVLRNTQRAPVGVIAQDETGADGTEGFPLATGRPHLRRQVSVRRRSGSGASLPEPSQEHRWRDGSVEAPRHLAWSAIRTRTGTMACGAAIPGSECHRPAADAGRVPSRTRGSGERPGRGP